jgi:hypothetical protein
MSIAPAQAKAIFLAALEQHGPQRADYLDAACANDPAVRQRIEAMLAAHEASGELLPRPPTDMLVDDRAGPDATTDDVAGNAASDGEALAFLDPPSREGTLGRLGHYHVQHVVGRGGFGIVLKAFDEKLHRMVAIKVLAPELAVNATARQRFIREARAAAAVTHEHVVAIHAIDEEHRPPFLVMQFVDGVSLQEKLNAKGALGLREILRIGGQIACGLAAAHKQGLVHRDIKPANILLENGVERVKITDFGLARTADDASLSQSGIVAGTPLYMSPEQAAGETVDPRSDLFSLGSVLYAMCTGRPPFRASTMMAVMKRVCDDAPTPVREVNPDIPDWLSASIARLHAKNPADRFQGAQEVAELLGQHLAQLQNPNVAATPVIVPTETHGALPWPSEADVERARMLREVCAPTVNPGLRCLWQSILVGTALGATVGFGLGLTDPKLVGMVDPPDWLRGDVALALVTLLQGAVIGAFFGALVGVVRWLNQMRLSWEMYHGLRRRSGVRGPKPAMTPGARRWALGSILLPIAAGVFVVVVVLAVRLPRGGQAVTLTCDDPELVVTLTGRNVQGIYVLDRGVNQAALPAGKYQAIARCGASRLIDSVTRSMPWGQINTAVDRKESQFDIELKKGEHLTLDIKTLAVSGSIAGKWESNFGPVTLDHKPIERSTPMAVTGSYVKKPEKKAIIMQIPFDAGDCVITQGTFDIVNGLLQISFAEPWWNGTGSARLKLSSDGQKLEGTWSNSAGESGIWTMIRKADAVSKQADRKPDDWMPLFNGTDLTGWKHLRGKSGDWRIEDRVLVGRGGGSYLISERGDYGNFELRMEAKLNEPGLGLFCVRMARPELPVSGILPRAYVAKLAVTPGGARQDRRPVGPARRGREQ